MAKPIITPSSAHPRTAIAAKIIPFTNVSGTSPVGLKPSINEPVRLIAIPITALSESFSFKIRYDNNAPIPG